MEKALVQEEERNCHACLARGAFKLYNLFGPWRGFVLFCKTSHLTPNENWPSLHFGKKKMMQTICLSSNKNGNLAKKIRK